MYYDISSPNVLARANYRFLQNLFHRIAVAVFGDLEMTTSYSSETFDITISSEDQNIWTSGPEYVLEWHEYFPIIGGDRELVIVSDARVVTGGGSVEIIGDRIQWDSDGEYDDMPLNSTSGVRIVYTVTLADGLQTDLFFDIEIKNSDVDGLEFYVPSQKVTYDKAFTFASLPADVVLQDGHQFERVTPIDITWDALTPTITGLLSELSGARDAARGLANDADEALDAAYTDMSRAYLKTNLADKFAAADIDYSVKLLAFQAASTAYEAAKLADEAVTKARSDWNKVITDYNTQFGVVEAAETAVQLASEAVGLANTALNTATQAVSDFLADIFNFFGLDELEAEVVAAQQQLISLTNTLLNKKLVRDAAKEALQDLSDAYFVAEKAYNTAVEQLSDVALSTLLNARDDASTDFGDALRTRAEALSELWKNGFFQNYAPSVLDIAVAAAEEIAAAGEVAAAELLMETTRIAANLADTAYNEIEATIADSKLVIDAEIHTDINVQAGLQVNMKMTAGSVDSDLDYTLLTATEVDSVADTFTILALAANAMGEDAVAFNTISPNLKFYAGIAFDIVADFEMMFDLDARFAGTTVIDFPDGPAMINETVKLSSWVDILDLDTSELGTLEVPIPFLGDIISLEANFPNIETSGTAAEVSADVYTDPTGLSMAEINAFWTDITNAKLEYGDEFKKLLDAAGISTELTQDAIQDALLPILEQIEATIDRTGDTDKDGLIPIFYLGLADSGQDGIFHINTLPDVIDQIDIDSVGSLGFFVGTGKSEDVFKVTIDVDQLAATIANVLLGNQPSTTINPMNIEIGIETILSKVNVSDNAIKAITQFVDIGTGVEMADLDVDLSSYITQKFALSVDDMDFVVTFEDGTQGAFSANDGGQFVFENASSLVDTNGNGVIDYSLSLTPDATFFNDTQVGLAVGYTLDYVKSYAKFLTKLPLDEIFGDFDWSEFGIEDTPALKPSGLDIGFGPLVRIEGDIDIGSADLFEAIFEYDAGRANISGSFDRADLRAAPEGRVVITENPVQGGVLFADTSGLTDLNGLGYFDYQWLRDGVAIQNATAPQYTARQADVGAAISVAVSYTDQIGTPERVISQPTAPVADVNDDPTGGVFISGPGTVGQRLVANVSFLSDSDGLGELQYQWFNGDVAKATSGGVMTITNADGTTSLITDRAFNAEDHGLLRGQTGQTYTPTTSDHGKIISVRVSYTDGGNTHEQIDASLRAPVPVLMAGTPGHDVIEGTPLAEDLQGMDGDDHVFGDGFELRYALPQANQVFRLYQATLDRAPDTFGHEAWAKELFTGELTLAQVTQGFVESREFVNKYGDFGTSDFIKALYRNVLDRDFDAGAVSDAEINAWTDALDAGTARTTVVTGFSESREFQRTTLDAANAVAVAANPAAWSDDVFRLYRATLDREPDAAGFMAWAQNLASGQSYLDVIGGFTRSGEFQKSYGDLSDTAAFITQLYQNVLNRAPDAGGLNGWLNAIETTGSRDVVVQGLAQSAEFKTQTEIELKDWIRANGIDDHIDGGAGTNVLSGGMMADKFVFRHGDDATNTVLDLEAWDYVSFVGFGYASPDDVRGHMTEMGGNTVFSDQNMDVTFTGIKMADLADDMFGL